MTWDDIHYYLNRQGLSAKTIATYKWAIRAYLEQYQEVTTESVNRFMREYSTAPAQQTGRVPSSYSINNAVKALKHLATYYKSDAMDNWKMKKCERGTIVLWNIEEQRQAIDEAYIMDYRFGCILHTFLTTGIRFSELRNCNVGDLMGDTLYVHGKSSKKRHVFIVDVCLRENMEELVRAILADDRSSVYLFGNARVHKPGRNAGSNNGPVSKEWVARMITALCKRLNTNKRPKIHHLRHIYATTQIKSGVDLETLRKILGHENILVTRGYVHIDDDDMRQAQRRNPHNRTALNAQDLSQDLRSIVEKYKETPYAARLVELGIMAPVESLI